MQGSSLWAIMGQSGGLLTGRTGQKWLPFTVSGFWRVFWTGLEYVALPFSEGEYATSPDGLNWTMRYLGVAETILSVVGIGDLRLMGTYSSLFYSYDGQTWEEYIAAPYGSYYGAAASETEAVMVTSDGQVVRYVLPQEVEHMKWARWLAIHPTH